MHGVDALIVSALEVDGPEVASEQQEQLVSAGAGSVCSKQSRPSVIQSVGASIWFAITRPGLGDDALTIESRGTQSDAAAEESLLCRCGMDFVSGGGSRQTLVRIA